MKKILFIFLASLICENILVNPSCSTTPEYRIYAKPEVVEYAIQEYTVAPRDPSVVMATYEKYMNQNDGSISIHDLMLVCDAGGMDRTQCDKFRDTLETRYYKVCNEDKGKTNGTEKCIDNFFFTTGIGTALGTGTRVRLEEAMALAQEYALVKDKQTIVCDNTTHSKNVADFVKCTSVDGKVFYEFKFASVSETRDADIITSLYKAICKLHDTEYISSNVTSSDHTDLVTPFTQRLPEMCDTTDKNKCNKINASFQRFSYGAHLGEMPVTDKAGYSKQHKGCLIVPFISDISELRTAYGIDNTVFKEVQYTTGDEVKKIIKNYVKQQLKEKKITFDEKHFNCAASTNLIKNGFSGEVITCYVNDKPIDFLFKDLSENKDYAQEAGLSKMACVQLGGKVDNKNCRGLYEHECTRLGNILIARGIQGTTYLQNKGGCILSATATERIINLTKEISAGIAITFVTEGATVFPVIVSIGTDLAFEAVQIWQDEIPYKDFKEFLSAAEECESLSENSFIGNESIINVRKYCMGNVLDKYHSLMKSEMKDLAPEIQNQLIQRMIEIVRIVGDESIAYINQSKVSALKKARSYASFALFGTLLVFNPEKWASKVDDIVEEFTRLQLKVSPNFGDLARAFKETGQLTTFSTNQLTNVEWNKLNNYLKPYDIELIDYVASDGRKYKKLFFLETAADNTNIFYKVYNKLPEAEIQRRLQYVLDHSKNDFDIVDNVIYVNIYNSDLGRQFGTDLGNETVAKLYGHPDLVERLRSWKEIDLIQNTEERERVIEELHYIITRERRTPLGNTDLSFDPGSADGGHMAPDIDNPFRKFEYNARPNNIRVIIHEVFHENIHAFQSVGKSTIPEPFYKISHEHYISPYRSREYYRKQILEQEAYDVADIATDIVMRAFNIIE